MKRLDEAHHGHIQLQTVRLHPLGDVADTCTHTVHESLSFLRTARPVDLRIVGEEMRMQTT